MGDQPVLKTYSVTFLYQILTDRNIWEETVQNCARPHACTKSVHRVEPCSPVHTLIHIMYLHCTVIYGQLGLTIGHSLWASWGQAGLQGVAMIYGLAWVC